MALNLEKVLLLIMVLVSAHKLLAKTTSNVGDFTQALATWYGDPYGAGSGGACGWANDVQSPPFSAMIAAGNAKLYLQGKGCGNCYQVLCTRQPYCSAKPITVTITDECPGTCNDVPFAFDLSGTAFGAMANPGQADNLRNLGRVDIQFRRVPCNYGVTTIAFKIDPMSNPYWFGMAIEFCEGDGGLISVEVSANGAQQFRWMKNIWGAVWAAQVDPSFRGPYTIRLISGNHEPVVAFNAIPYGFAPGQTYYSHVNFRS
uniref:expansin-B15-like n=1 Tax=Erigeron canadensis TaxID=72917 RepID=UPI001CB90824|nr:expansin-B15-like [Erigeron canadensis]